MFGLQKELDCQTGVGLENQFERIFPLIPNMARVYSKGI
jgi:hypothetical protein